MSTLLIVPVFAHDAEHLRAAHTAALQAGADLIELRVDLSEGVKDEDIRALRETPGVPVILTIRAAAEGGQWERGDDERISRLIELGPIADYIDVELSTWRRSANIRQKIGLALTRAAYVSQADGREEIVNPGKRKLILSLHELRDRPPRLHADFLAMLGEPACAVPKLVWRARTIRDNFEAFELMRQSPRPAIVICLGESGLLSRVLSRKFGAFATFAALTPGAQTAPGQPTADDLRRRYRWDAIDEETHVYGVVGHPLGHSLSPVVHNAAFAALEENAVYLPMPVGPGYESFKAFIAEVLARPWLDFRGFSVTTPHKENARRYLRETGRMIEPLAERIGAVNTMTLDGNGCLSGYNTDAPAVLASVMSLSAPGAPGLGRGVPPDMAPAPGAHPPSLGGLRVAVLGAGGVARAVVAALSEAGAEITIYNRSSARAAALAETFNSRHAPWEARAQAEADLLVNCTTLGMWPDTAASPMPADALTARMAVFETIYNPPQTRLLRDAAERGCAVIDGLFMFLHQARAQSRLWTGRTAPPEVFRAAVESAASS